MQIQSTVYQVVTGYVAGVWGVEWVENENHRIFASREDAEKFMGELKSNPKDPPPRIVEVRVILPSKG